jgi:hypothetical protein
MQGMKTVCVFVYKATQALRGASFKRFNPVLRVYARALMPFLQK